MPEQKPSSRIISRSKVVRWRRRAASSARPCSSSQATRSSASASIVPIAACSLSAGVTKWLAGKTLTSVRSARSSPVSGSSSVIRSTSSPKNSTRTRRSSDDGHELQGVAAHAEPRPLEGLVVALVLEVHEVAQDGVAPVRPAALEAQDGGPVVDRRAQAVDAADRGHDDHVAPLEERLGGRVAELVDLLVAAGVLLDVRVRPRAGRPPAGSSRSS